MAEVNGEVETNRGGRPVGTGDDPNKLSRAQVIADAKFYREMALDLREWYKANKGTISLEDRLKCMNAMRDAVIQGLKFHLAPAKAAAPTSVDDAFDAEAFYKEIAGTL